MAQLNGKLLELIDLSSGYGKVKIVQQITMAVPEGEILAVIGRNGVGKTTLIKAIIGALPAFSGDIRFKGDSIAHRSAHDRARIGFGYVPQGRGIFSRLTVVENLYMGERIGKGPVSASNYERVYGFFPILRERGAQMAGSLSGGEQQQLALGRALLNNPGLVLLDEPSEGIQPNIVQEIGVLLRRLCTQERLTVVLVEQNLDLIRSMADRCLVMDKGTVVAELTPDELNDVETAKRYLAI